MEDGTVYIYLVSRIKVQFVVILCFKNQKWLLTSDWPDRLFTFLVGK